MAAISDFDYYKERFGFWNKVYGLKMLDMKNQYFKEAFLDNLNEESIISSKQPIFKLNLNKINLNEISFI